MTMKESHHKDNKKCEKNTFKIPRRALKELEYSFETLDRDLVDIYREADRYPILAYQNFVEVMNKFSGRNNKIDARLFDYVGLTEAFINNPIPEDFAFEVGPTPPPPAVAAPPLVTPPPPPRPPQDLPPINPGQIRAIRNIIQQAIDDVRTLLSVRAYLVNEVIPTLGLTEDDNALEVLNFFISEIISARIQEVITRATVDILTVLTGI